NRRWRWRRTPIICNNFCNTPNDNNRACNVWNATQAEDSSMKPVHPTASARIAFAFAALFGIASAAHADTPIHSSHDATPDAQVVIRNVKGDVRVTGWNENRVQVDGSLGSGAKPLQITGTPGSLVIQVESNTGSGWFNLGGSDSMGPTSLDVHVPHAAALE